MPACRRQAAPSAEEAVQLASNFCIASRAKRNRWYSKNAQNTSSTTTITVVATGCALASHVSHTASASSPKLNVQLLNGSGLVFTAARALAFVPCEVSATPPASSAAAQRHSAPAPPAAAYARSAAAGGRMKV